MPLLLLNSIGRLPTVLVKPVLGYYPYRIRGYKDVEPFVEYEYESRIIFNVNLKVEVELIQEKRIAKPKEEKILKKNTDILFLLDEDFWLLEENKNA